MKKLLASIIINFLLACQKDVLQPLAVNAQTSDNALSRAKGFTWEWYS